MSGDPPPRLSVVVAIVSDTTARRADGGHLAACLDALSSQRDAPAMEIIVPHSRNLEGLDDLRRRFPGVNFIAVEDPEVVRPGPGREHHDVLRARGLAATRGDVVGLVEDHARPDPRWCASVMAAHRQPHAAIGGAIDNAVDRPLNWAVYFCDFGRYQPPLPAGPSSTASDANITYKRSSLDAVSDAWRRSFREVVVHRALLTRGETVALDPDALVYQNRAGMRLGAALQERFIWGRSYAATRTVLLRPSTRAMYAALSPLLPAVLLLRMTRTAWTRRRRFGKFLRALPFTVLLLAAWSLGEGTGYVAGRAHRASRP